MKKYGLLLILVCLMFVVGCFSGNYFKVPTEDQAADEESELIKEIQEIEKQLQNIDEESEEVVDEETTDEDIEEILDEDEEIVDEDIEEIMDEEEILDEETEELEEEEELVIDTTSLEKLEVQETDLVNLEIDVEDLDEDTVTYTFSKPLDSNGRWQTAYGDAGEYVVTITANDGKVTSEKNILLVVQKKNVPPVIEGLQSTMKTKEGDVVALTPKVSDPNKDDIELVFPSPFDEVGVWETDHTSAGVYDLTVEASDGEMKATFDITLTVEDVNVPPAIEGLEEELTVAEGDTITLEPVVTDLDGDDVKVTISEPIGNDGVWETTYIDHGEYVVTVTADDGKDEVSFVIDLTVEDINVAPEIIGVRLS